MPKLSDSRLENSPYLCVFFNYAQTVKQKVWSEAEKGERALQACEAHFTHMRLSQYTKPILREKLTVLQSKMSPDSTSNSPSNSNKENWKENLAII